MMSIQPILTLGGHSSYVNCVAFSSDGARIVSGSSDKSLMVWDTTTGKEIGAPLQHDSTVYGLALSPDNKRIVSCMGDSTLHIWDGVTGKALGSPLKGHTAVVRCVAFSPDGQQIASGSDDMAVRIWDTTTGQPISSPLQGHTYYVYGVAWSPDGKRVVSAGDQTLRIWDSVTGKQIGSPLQGHTIGVICVAVSTTGRIVSASFDNTLRMWDVQTGEALGSPLVGHTGYVRSAAFSPDGTLIVSGSDDKTIRMWDGVTGEAIGSPVQAHSELIMSIAFSPDGRRIASGSNDKSVRVWDSMTVEAPHYAKQFTIKIDDNPSDPSVLAIVSDATARCKKGELDAAMRKFDVAIAISSSSPKSVTSVCSVLVIKAIALFEAGSEETGIARLEDLIELHLEGNAGFQMVKIYMLNQVAQKAFKRGQYDRAVELLSETTGKDHLSRTMDIYHRYRTNIPSDEPEGLAIVTRLFGWEFETLRYTTNQTLCEALRCIGRPKEALDAAENMSKKLKEGEQKQYNQWLSGFKKECATEWSEKGDQALKDGHYDTAIEQYTGSIALDPSNYNLYLNRSSAYASKQLWNEALNDSEQAIKLDPSLGRGYERKYYALHGEKRYDEAIEAFRLLVGKSNPNSDNQYANPDDTEAKIKAVASDMIKDMPTRLFDTTSGVLCNHGDMLRKFKESDVYKRLVSSITTREELDMGDSIADVVNSYFRYAMLSHRWEDGEILLQDIGEGQSIHEMKSNSPGLPKLQNLCVIALGHGLLWAWSDTCCIDKKDAVELQESIASMYHWYSGSALTIIYLSDVDESSSAEFTASKWFTRGWTLQELLAPPVIIFYKRDWSVFWDEEADDAIPVGNDIPLGQAILLNHKECDEILYMIEQVAEIDAETLRSFQPGMQDTRQKLRWASRRKTTKVEDAAYSLFGLFDIHLPVIYGEKDKALGRLLQEIVGQTGELAVLDWVGQRGRMHSCLPLDISSFSLTQWMPPLLDDTEITAQISSLRESLLPDEITKLVGVRKRLQNLPVPRFLQNRLSLPCIVYPVKAVNQHSGRDRKIRPYAIKAAGLKEFDIQTSEIMNQGSEARPSQQKYFVAHIMRDDILDQLMEVPDDEATGVFEMVVALSRPFLPFLLVQRGKAYHRIAALDDTTTQVEDMLAVRAEGMNVTIVDIL